MTIQQPAMGPCPICAGSLRQPLDAPSMPLEIKRYIAGYHEADDTIPCDNCRGGGGMGSPTGRVWLDPFGTPCMHRWTETSTQHQRNHGQHYYHCPKCGDNRYIDSGD